MAKGRLVRQGEVRGSIMPHAAYLNARIWCPWPGCGFRIELIDFQLELQGNPAFYAQVMMEWGRLPGYGLIGRCPGCRQHVLYSAREKQPIDDPSTAGLPVLPDDWHLNAVILANNVVGGHRRVQQSLAPGLLSFSLLLITAACPFAEAQPLRTLKGHKGEVVFVAVCGMGTRN
jgi:hypothetical protein